MTQEHSKLWLVQRMINDYEGRLYEAYGVFDSLESAMQWALLNFQSVVAHYMCSEEKCMKEFITKFNSDYWISCNHILEDSAFDLEAQREDALLPHDCTLHIAPIKYYRNPLVPNPQVFTTTNAMQFIITNPIFSTTSFFNW